MTYAPLRSCHIPKAELERRYDYNSGQLGIGCSGCVHSQVIVRDRTWFRLGCFHPDVMAKGKPVAIVNARQNLPCGPAARLFEAKT